MDGGGDGAVSRAANERSRFEISIPWRYEIWRLGIPSTASTSFCMVEVPSCTEPLFGFGGRIDAGGGESQGAGWERGTKSSPSPQPTSRTYNIRARHTPFIYYK